MGDLVAVFRAPRTTVSWHLACLPRAGLVRVRRDYSLGPSEGRFHRKRLDCLGGCFDEVRELAADRRRYEWLEAGCCAERRGAGAPGGEPDEDAGLARAPTSAALATHEVTARRHRHGQPSPPPPGPARPTGRGSRTEGPCYDFGQVARPQARMTNRTLRAVLAGFSLLAPLPAASLAAEAPPASVPDGTLAAADTPRRRADSRKARHPVGSSLPHPRGEGVR